MPLSPKIKEKSSFSTILLESFNVWIQELWCQSQKVLWRCFNSCWTDWLKEKCKTSQQADTELTQYRKFISETKTYCHNKFASYSIALERLDKFLNELLNNQKKLWRIVGPTLGSLLYCLMDKSYSRQRIFCQQGSSCSKPSRNEFEST